MTTISSDRWDVELRRGGFALPATILALVVIGGLVTGAFYAASQEGRVGATTRMTSEAFYLAERGIEEVFGTWMVADFRNVVVGETSEPNTVVVSNGGAPVGRYETRVRRLSERLSLIQSTGEVLNRGRYTGARRDIGMLVRLLNFDVPLGSAMYVYGNLNIGGTAEVSGFNFNPWPAICDFEPDGAGAIVNADGEVIVFGNGEIDGDPPHDKDPDMDQQEMMTFGDVDYDELAAMADIVVPAPQPAGYKPSANTTDGFCNVNDQLNWGSPVEGHPCFDHFPIVRLLGEDNTYKLSDGEGQGVLLVDGDLHVAGNFVYYGIILVRGQIRSTSGNNRLNGVVIAGGSGDLDSYTLGSTEIRYSTCAVERARQNSMRPAPVADRAWVDLSGAGVGL